MPDAIAHTITDDRFRGQEPVPVLNRTDPVSMEMTVNAGPIGHILIRVFDANRTKLADSGALSTGDGAALWTFAPGALAAPRFVLSHKWASCTGPRPLQFTVRVRATQGDRVFTSSVKVQMEEADEIVRITEIGDFLAIGEAFA